MQNVYINFICIDNVRITCTLKGPVIHFNLSKQKKTSISVSHLPESYESITTTSEKENDNNYPSVTSSKSTNFENSVTTSKSPTKSEQSKRTDDEIKTNLNDNSKQGEMNVEQKMTTGSLASTIGFSRPSEISSVNLENQENVSSNVSSNNPLDSSYSRVNDDRYVHLSDTSDSVRNSSNYNGRSVSDYNPNEHNRIYEHASIVTSTAFERYDPNYSATRSAAAGLYSYGQQMLIEDLNNPQKLVNVNDSTTTTTHHIKSEQDESTGPVYPRPIYHFDPTGSNLPTGFSAINLSVKIASAAQGSYRGSASPSPNGPIIDLSTSNITSSNPYRKSPQPGTSPNIISPQAPSPAGQTLDLSLSRITHR